MKGQIEEQEGNTQAAKDAYNTGVSARAQGARVSWSRVLDARVCDSRIHHARVNVLCVYMSLYMFLVRDYSRFRVVISRCYFRWWQLKIPRDQNTTNTRFNLPYSPVYKSHPSIGCTPTFALIFWCGITLK